MSFTSKQGSEVPVPVLISRMISGQIQSGELAEGDRLPTVRQLTQSLEVSPVSVIQAYDMLEREGLIIRRRGHGVFVQKPPQHHPKPPAERVAADSELPLRGLPGELAAELANSGRMVSTKLYIPRVRPNFVMRPRLTERLNRSLTKKLTLVSAPAGFGKTSVLAEWRASNVGRKTHVAWVSLDQGDNDPVRFWVHVCAAMVPLMGGDLRLQPFLNALTVGGQPDMMQFLQAIETIPQACLLVLDDYHVIVNQEIHRSVATLLEYMPPRVHLLLSTREDPPLPLALLRGRGDLLELKTRDLRFTPEEVAAFFEQQDTGLKLSAEVARRLEMQTEGWIAGLQLFALTLGEGGDLNRLLSTFSGNSRHIGDYLTDEVLRRQPEHIQNFLLETSILERLSGPLCDAVTQRSGSQSILATLEQQNLFLVGLDDQRQWFRYHQMFGEMLRSRLVEQRPAQVHLLHIRASEWYEACGLVEPAVDHALAARDIRRAARIIREKALWMWSRGETSVVLSWLNHLPHELISADPRLGLLWAEALLSAGRLDSTDGILQQVEKSALECRSQGNEKEAQQLLGRVAVVRVHRVRLLGDFQGAIAQTHAVLPRLPESELGLRAALFANLAVAYHWGGDVVSAKETYEVAGRLNMNSNNLYLAMWVTRFHGDLLRRTGQLQQAAELYDRAYRSHAAFPAEEIYPAIAYILLGLGELCYERNQLEQAEAHLQRCLELSRRGGYPDILLDALLLLALIKQANGDEDGARVLINHAGDVAHSVDVSWGVTRWSSYQAKLALLQGDLRLVAQWVRDGGSTCQDDLFSPMNEPLILVRAFLALNQPEKAMELLERLSAVTSRALQTGGWIEVLVVKAHTFLALGEVSAALDTLAYALPLAETERFFRVFVDEGAPMATLLSSMYVRLGERHGDQSRLRNYVAELLSALGRELPSLKTAAIQPIEQLTERELEVLRLIALGHTNERIARELFITVGTVKGHTSRIYGKLQASNRTEAVMKARQLGLL